MPKNLCAVAVAMAGLLSLSGNDPSAAQTDALRDPIWSKDGRHLAFVSDRTGLSQVYVARADGTDAHQVTTGRGPFFYPEFSPDGSTLVAMEYRAPEVTIWTVNVDGSGQRRLTPLAEFNADPRWTARGDAIVLHGRRGGEDDIYIMAADGSGLRKITDTPAHENTPVPSPNGRDLVFVTDAAGQLGLMLTALDGSNGRMLSSDPARMHLVPKWSPDGRRLAYYAMDPEAGNASAEIMVFDLASGAHRQVTTNGYRDQGPAWSTDGSRLIFTSTRDGRMSLYTVDLESGLERPFPVRYRPSGRRVHSGRF